MVDYKRLMNIIHGAYCEDREVLQMLKAEGLNVIRLQTNTDDIGQVRYDFEHGEVVQVTNRIRIPNSKNEKWKPKISPWAWFVVCQSVYIDP